MAAKRKPKRRVAKATPRKKRAKRTVKENFPSKLDVHFMEAKAVFDAARNAGWSQEFALAFAMDRSSYPDWIVPADDPLRKIDWEDGEEDN